jgi:hypothetical protein
MKTPLNRHLPIFSTETEFFDFFGGKFIKVLPIIHDNKLYFGCVNQSFMSGDLYYDVNKKSIQMARKDYDGTDRSRVVIVAFPDEIEFIIYDGCPHDRAYNYKRGYYVELIHPDTLEEIKEGKKYLSYLSVESIMDETNGPYPISLEYIYNKVVLHLKKR